MKLWDWICLLWLRLRLLESEHYTRLCECEGLLVDRELRLYRGQSQALRVRIALLESKL